MIRLDLVDAVRFRSGIVVEVYRTKD